MSGDTKYDPSLLREALRRWRDGSNTGIDKLRTELILSEVFKSKPPISVPSLNKFINGKYNACAKKGNELKFIWDFMIKHERYHMLIPKREDSSTASPEGLGIILANFFSRSGDTFDIEHFRTKFVGTYILYRPDWARRLPTEYYRVSKLEIHQNEQGVRITEIQKVSRASQEDFNQSDEGSMFSCGPYAYWLMRQIEGGGTRVALGVIEKAFPYTRDSGDIEWFQGILFAASHYAIFPRAKFFCRRYSTDNLPKFGIMTLDDLDDDDARNYLDLPPRRRTRSQKPSA